MTALSRRTFLRAALLSAAGWFTGCQTRSPTTTQSTPTAASPQPDFLLAPPPLLEAGRLTAIDQLYIQTYSRDLEPEVNLDSYQLTIGGLVETPQRLTWADIRALPEIDHMQTLECIGNPVGGHLIGNILWKGVALRAVLEGAGLKSQARYLIMSAADEYFTAVPLELALDDHSLLAFEANGAPLPPAHGYPLRVLLPGVYGQKQPKWITSLRLAEDSQPGTWEKQGWSDTALVQINSKIEYPPAGSVIPARQSLRVSGIAFADTSGVARVELSVDDGENWLEARRLNGPTTHVWTAWEFEWDSPTAGRHLLQARATDGNGNIQVAEKGVLAGVFPDGTSAIHSITITGA